MAFQWYTSSQPSPISEQPQQWHQQEPVHITLPVLPNIQQAVNPYFQSSSPSTGWGPTPQAPPFEPGHPSQQHFSQQHDPASLSSSLTLPPLQLSQSQPSQQPQPPQQPPQQPQQSQLGEQPQHPPSAHYQLGHIFPQPEPYTPYPYTSPTFQSPDPQYAPQPQQAPAYGQQASASSQQASAASASTKKKYILPSSMRRTLMAARRQRLAFPSLMRERQAVGKDPYPAGIMPGNENREEQDYAAWFNREGRLDEDKNDSFFETERRLHAAAVLNNPEQILMYALSWDDSTAGVRLYFTRILCGDRSVDSDPDSDWRNSAMVQNNADPGHLGYRTFPWDDSGPDGSKEWSW